MDIDLAALRAIEREKEIPFDVLVRTIEQALLLAYHRTEGAHPSARVELDRKSGHVVVWAPRRTTRARCCASTTTPGRVRWVAATTARQTILQRLRDAEDEQVLGRIPRQGGRHRLRRHPASPTRG